MVYFKNILSSLIIFSFTCVYAYTDTFTGSLMPAQGNEDYLLRGTHGTLKLKFTKKTEIGLFANWKTLRLNERKCLYGGVDLAHPGWESKELTLPKHAYVRFDFPNIKVYEKYHDTTLFNHITGLFFNQQVEHLPSESEPYLIAKIIGVHEHNQDSRRMVFKAQAEGEDFLFINRLSSNLFGVLSKKDIKPFEQYAKVTGTLEKDILITQSIILEPVGDPFQFFDKKLANVISIGDSISCGYLRYLRQSLSDIANTYHPPVNCGPSPTSVNSLDKWLNAHELKDREWDCIAFNHGHWDVNKKQSKEMYQANLEFMISRMKNTGAELIFVTTAPIPKGFSPEAKLDEHHLKQGTQMVANYGHKAMEKFMNPWALEVMKKHPEIWICDQWQHVKDNKSGIFTDWWELRNVHFSPEMSQELGELLAQTVRKALKNPKRKGAKNVAPITNLKIYDFKSFSGAPKDQIVAKQGFTDERLLLSIVDYTEIKGSKIEIAKKRVKLAQKDLDNHNKLESNGTVPPDEVLKAERIYRSAVKELEKLNKMH